MKKKLSLAILMGMALMVSACDSETQQTQSATSSSANPSANPIPTAFSPELVNNQKFQLVEADGTSISKDLNAFIQFEDGLNVSGKMCNNFFGVAQQNGDLLTGQFGMTMMLCGDETLNRLDQTIGQLFSAGAKAQINDKMLTLSNNEHKLIFKSVGAVEKTKPETTENKTMVTAEQLIHHQFKLIAFNGKPLSLEVPEMAPTIAFGENLSISGKMCNAFNGQATLADGVLSAQNGLAMTRMLCGDSELNQLDAVIGSMMTQGAHIELNNNQLTLQDGENTLKYELSDLM